jgi:8-oxo-dGTP pyrophosphatase MutT (NUDIX family)
VPRKVEKVVCYVLHDGHLLVFTHDAHPLEVTGVQVPAGSVEPGESPEQAAVRELSEETGRLGQVVRKIGTLNYDLRPVRNEIAIRHFFQLRMPTADIHERWSAGESDTSDGNELIAWTCWWLPLEDAHVLAAGFGALIGSMLELMDPSEGR